MSSATYSIRSLSSVFLFAVFLYGKQSQANEAIVFKVLPNNVLDVRYKGKFGQFCASDNNFDTQIAGAVCQQMGMTFKDSTDISSSSVPPTQITVYNVKCTNTTLDSCNFTPPQGSDTCPTHTTVGTQQISLSVTLKCHDITNVHLISTGSDPHSGVVEVVRGAERDVVCYDSAKSANVANVVCKQMGYIGGTVTDTSRPVGYLGKSLDISCTSGSANLDECLVEEVKSGCSTILHVQCTLTSVSQITFDVRLSQSSKAIVGATNGTVEVFQYGKWGVICDTGWDINDANVVCRQLGFKKALGFQTDAKFGQGTGTVFWNNMTCSGEKQSIKQCQRNQVFGTDACNSVKASGVICSSEKLESKEICKNTVVSLEPGITFIRSPGFPETFEYSMSSNNICSLNITSPTPTNFTVYIQQKMFQNNHNESLSFKTSDGRVETLYGDNSTQGPMTFDTESLTIEFQANGANGANGNGKFSIMVSVPQPPHPPPTPSTTAVSSAPTGMPTLPSPDPIKEEPEAVNVGVIVGATLGVVFLIAIIVIPVFVVCKKKEIFSIKQKKRKNSVGSFDKSLDKLEHGGEVNLNYIEDETTETKENDLYERTGNGTAQQVGTPGRTDVYTENLESKEPETGEMKRNGSIGRPASGSEVKVDFANQAYNPYEFEGQPQLNDSAYELKQPLNNGVESALEDNVDSHQYAVVNKPWRVPKGQAPAAPSPQPHGTITENANQDIDNGNVDDGSDVVPPVVYAEVNKPTSFIPGLSTAYADVEIDVGGAPSIQPDRVPPKQETTEKETKKGKKKKKKKKEEDIKKKDKKGKDKNKKKGLGSSGDVSDERPKGDSCAVPMDNPSAGINAEVGQTSMGQSGPVSGSQQVESDQMYDVLQRKGPKQRPAANVGVTDQTYESVNYKV